MCASKNQHTHTHTQRETKTHSTRLYFQLHSVFNTFGCGMKFDCFVDTVKKRRKKKKKSPSHSVCGWAPAHACVWFTMPVLVVRVYEYFFLSLLLVAHVYINSCISVIETLWVQNGVCVKYSELVRFGFFLRELPRKKLFTAAVASGSCYCCCSA